MQTVWRNPKIWKKAEGASECRVLVYSLEARYLLADTHELIVRDANEFIPKGLNWVRPSSGGVWWFWAGIAVMFLVGGAPLA
jgi:hypothetical protein